MPPASIARAMIPSSASISRTRCPRPNPPMAGLQDMAPIEFELVGGEQRARTHSSTGCGSLASGVAPADDDDVELLHGAYVRCGASTRQDRDSGFPDRVASV